MRTPIRTRVSAVPTRIQSKWRETRRRVRLMRPLLRAGRAVVREIRGAGSWRLSGEIILARPRGNDGCGRQGVGHRGQAVRLRNVAFRVEVAVEDGVGHRRGKSAAAAAG